MESNFLLSSAVVFFGAVIGWMFLFLRDEESNVFLRFVALIVICILTIITVGPVENLNSFVVMLAHRAVPAVLTATLTYKILVTYK